VDDAAQSPAGGRTLLRSAGLAFAGQESPMRLGIPELLVILAIVILIFGASRLPELGRGIGKGIKNFKDATKDGSKPEQS
jgi:sec-independent protein translocase protein TatA